MTVQKGNRVIFHCDGNVFCAGVEERLYLKWKEVLMAGDRVEGFGIDESFSGLTGSLRRFGGDPVRLADEIRMRMHREIGLTMGTQSLESGGRRYGGR